MSEAFSHFHTFLLQLWPLKCRKLWNEEVWSSFQAEPGGISAIKTCKVLKTGSISTTFNMFCFLSKLNLTLLHCVDCFWGGGSWQPHACWHSVDCITPPAIGFPQLPSFNKRVHLVEWSCHSDITLPHCFPTLNMRRRSYHYSIISIHIHIHVHIHK